MLEFLESVELNERKYENQYETWKVCLRILKTKEHVDHPFILIKKC